MVEKLASSITLPSIEILGSLVSDAGYQCGKQNQQRPADVACSNPGASKGLLRRQNCLNPDGAAGAARPWMWHAAKATACPLRLRPPACRPQAKLPGAQMAFPSPRGLRRRSLLLPAARLHARPRASGPAFPRRGAGPRHPGPARRGGGSRRGRFPRSTARPPAAARPATGRGAAGPGQWPAAGLRLPRASRGPAALGGCAGRLAGTAGG